MKKLTILAALLAMLLMAFAPLVLAQEETESPSQPVLEAAPSLIVGCQVLFNDPAATCEVDENGFITLPDGSLASVVIEPDGTAYTVGEDGSLTVIGQGSPITTEEEPDGPIQYDNAEGEPQTPVDVPAAA